MFEREVVQPAGNASLLKPARRLLEAQNLRWSDVFVLPSVCWRNDDLRFGCMGQNPRPAWSYYADRSYICKLCV